MDRGAQLSLAVRRLGLGRFSSSESALHCRGGELREKGGPRSPRRDQRVHPAPVGAAPGVSALAAAWQALQENAERMAVKVLAGQASSILSQARAAAWLPELPPKGNAPVSPYISEILQYLDVSPCDHPSLCPTGNTPVVYLTIPLSDVAQAPLELLVTHDSAVQGPVGDAGGVR